MITYFFNCFSGECIITLYLFYGQFVTQSFAQVEFRHLYDFDEKSDIRVKRNSRFRTVLRYIGIELYEPFTFHATPTTTPNIFALPPVQMTFTHP